MSKLKPLGERVVIQAIEKEEMTRSGLVLPDTAKEKPQEGKVIAVGPGKILENGRLIRDMYLFEVKKPAESKGPWDYYKQVATIPGEQAFKRPGGNECPLVKG